MITDLTLLLAAAMTAFSAVALLLRVPAFADNLDRYGVRRSWWPWLATVKLVGAAALVLGLRFPTVGVIAAACLVAYFLGAVVTVVRAQVYQHVAIPVAYLVPPALAGLLLAAGLG